MQGEQLIAVVEALQASAVRVWVGGGWGIDALLGARTRPHRDADLMHDVRDEPVLLAVLGAAGFVQTLDQRPVRFVLAHPDGRELDLHPLEFAPDGSAVQRSFDPDRPFPYPADCFVTGLVLGVPVPCLSAAQQVFFHQGYEPADRDRADMAHLRRAFGIATHF
ncbi:nucleotidyltransferase domain-containing protein [Kitasatospora sp. NE20-6]|uniref:nucleotidyltransferase domain-containing protein n=1 Tax=Kitasatospora sp. NE20-6 TaxID=2859066 RepID=UPI0038B3B1E7